MPVSTNEFKNGMVITVDGNLQEVVYFQHVKPGKGGAFVRTKLKNLKSGAVVERTFRAGEKFEVAHLETRQVQYLYTTDQSMVFMDNTDYEQIELTKAQIGESAQYITEGMELAINYVDGNPLGVQLPITVELEISETAPGVRGDTVSGGTKPATLETGGVINVPLFLNPGDKVKVDTRTGAYISRV